MKVSDIIMYIMKLSEEILKKLFAKHQTLSS